MTPPLQRRVAATQRTLNRFKDKPWKLGRYDCAQLVRHHLIAMGTPIKVQKGGTYHSLLGAQRALRRLGHENLASLMDAHFERITPAAALVGDVIAMPGQEGPGALSVSVGNGRALAWHEDVPGAVVVQPVQYEAAWRIEV